MKQQPSPYVLSFLTLRKIIGIVGIAMPALLLLGTFTIGNCTQVQYSISHYYYTIMGDLFVGTLFAVAIFLLVYKGYDRYDNIATNIAGIFALIIPLFATSNNPDTYCALRTLPEQTWRVAIHYTAAALFFCTLAYISLFLFTKSKGIKTGRKIIRNRVYMVCGIVMLVVLLMIILVKATPWFDCLLPYHPVFWFEWLALLAFGTSWLVKGEVMLVDKE